jgi:basic membrane lipoprotein Med (substrate-binding protein (PBP1-ABC) superfamily)
VRAGLIVMLVTLALWPARAEEPLTVAAVFGTTIEEPWAQRIHAALLGARDEHAITYDWSDDVAPEDLPGVLRDYAEQGYDLITGDSFGAEVAARAVARDYPGITFVLGSGAGPSAPNLSVFDNWIHEPAFLAGMIAGGLTESNKVGVVAAVDGVPGFRGGVAAIRARRKRTMGAPVRRARPDRR